MKNTLYSLILFISFAVPALATVRVTAPSTGEAVTSPARFAATATTTCSKGVASMGVYVDNSLKYVVNGAYLSTSIALPGGRYNTVIEEWDRCGGATFTAINSISVAGGSSSGGGSGIPSNAVSSGNLTGSGGWAWNHDRGTPGSSVGYSAYAVSSPSLDGRARELAVSYSDHGGEIYHLTFGHDMNATHFVYDAYVYLVNPSQIGNIEMDMNQVISNGRTVILGTQCSSYSRTWEFSTVRGKSPHWNSSNIPCNPKTWSAYTWHHIQIASQRSSSGYATYDWVNLDGKVSYFKYAGGASSLALGWTKGDLLLNFQLDGASGSSGSMKMYMDKMTIYRW